jgi:hypothetical protein
VLILKSEAPLSTTACTGSLDVVLIHDEIAVVVEPLGSSSVAENSVCPAWFITVYETGPVYVVVTPETVRRGTLSTTERWSASRV